MKTKWITSVNSVLWARSRDKDAGRAKVAAFDLDGTLIRTKSGKVYPKDANDWLWWHSTIPRQIFDLYNKGYRIVIFSNQNGLREDKLRRQAFQGKMENILLQLPMPVTFMAALEKDQYRKPVAGMWQLLEKEESGGVAIDKEESFYVGDAAGRAKAWKDKAPKDISCVDRKFAANAGIKFFTPEEYFLKEAVAPFSWGGFEPKLHPDTLPLFLPTTTPLIQEKGAEIVLLVGYPASGKSRFAKKHLVPKGYCYINQDTLKMKKKCIVLCKQSLDAQQPVVVDNTNPDAATRALYIKLARDASVPIRCFLFTADEHMARHNNIYRVVHHPKENRTHLPDVAFRMFKSKFQEPTLSEGFAEIKKINFVFDGSDQDRKIWEQWWV